GADTPLSRAMAHGEGAAAPPLAHDEKTAWTEMAERGSFRALRFIRWFYRTLGRRATIALPAPVSAYFFVTSRPTRRASIDYLRTLWATPAGRAALRRPPTCWHA